MSSETSVAALGLNNGFSAITQAEERCCAMAFNSLDPIQTAIHSIPWYNLDHPGLNRSGQHQHCNRCSYYAYYCSSMRNHYCGSCSHGVHEYHPNSYGHKRSTDDTAALSDEGNSISTYTPSASLVDKPQVSVSGRDTVAGKSSLGSSNLTAITGANSAEIVVDAGLSTVKGHLPDDDYAYLEKNDITVILNTNEQAQIVDANFSFATSTCLIYAENVIINGNISLSGKNLGIFCSNLSLVGSPTTIDVSGNRGTIDAKFATVTSGPGHIGGNGENGGNIWIFVEFLTSDILPNLKLIANGGDGSTGGATSEPMMIGGKGGDGGNAGKITLTYASVTYDVLQKVVMATSAPWVDAVKSSHDIILPALQEVDPPLQATVVETHTDVVTLYSQYAASLDALINTLTTLLEPIDINAPFPSQLVETAATDLRKLAQAEFVSVHAPVLTTGQEYQDIDAVTLDIKDWINNPRASNADKRIIASMNSLSLDSNQTATSSLVSSIQSLMLAVAGSYQETLISARYRVCTVNKGNRGRGGPSGSAIPPGDPGTDGLDGTVIVKNLGLDGGLADLQMPAAFAFPEQCRMLLNKADTLYFSNDVSTWTDAASYYQRLAKRLAFVPNMVADMKKSQLGSNSSQLAPLSQAYQELEYTSQLTMSALSQLESVYGMATKKLSRMALGQDMFGHDSTWAPRLSINSYRDRVQTLLPLLQDLETQTEKYQQAVANASDMTASVNQGLSSTRAAKAQADARIQLLSDDNGPMQMAAYQIVLYTPLLKAKRQEIKKAIAIVTNDIQKKMTFHPQDVIDALGMLAFCPSKGLAAAQGIIQTAGVVYKSWSQLTDSSGQSVNKDYIISQLATCSDSLESLTQAFSSRTDGTIEVDDPGAMKIIATEQNVKSLLDRFKDSIPDSDSSTLKKDLDDYMDLITSRNTAVLQYNSALQMLQEAQLDSAYAATRVQELGQAGLKVDPNLPAIAFWLTKMRDDLRLDIMERLNYQDRAIQYWGLVGPSTYGAPGPLRGYDALSLDQETLATSFETALGIYANNVWSTWPIQAEQNASGLFYKLSAGEVSALIQFGSVIVRIPPNHPVFSGRSNVRLSQVRVWVVGASVAYSDARGRQPLMIEITQMGRETVVSHIGEAFSFTHDAVDIQFTYDSKGVASFADCTSDRIFNTEVIQGDFSGGLVGASTMAGIGPFAAWRIEVRPSENPGLLLAKGSEAYIEFWGGSSSFS